MSEILIAELNEDSEEADLYRIIVLVMLQNEGWQVTITQDLLDKLDLDNKTLLIVHSDRELTLTVKEIM